MASRMNRFGWCGGRLLAGLAFGWMTGCASNDVLPLPPGGLLSDTTRSVSRADEQAAPTASAEAAVRKTAAKAAKKEAAAAAAAAKKTAAAEKDRRRKAEKEAAAEARRAAADGKAAAQKTRAVEPAQREDAASEEARPDEASGISSEPVLQVGDEIDIQVYREPELSGTFKINAAGEIRHSLAGSIPMAGKTVAEAEAFFTRKLAQDYLVDPRVIVKLLSTQSSQIVLMGEVEKPGVYPLPFGETTTLLQAIAGAGGFTELASPDRVRIVRRMPDGHQATMKIRVSDLLGGKGKQRDVTLEPNDVIMVPEVLF